MNRRHFLKSSGLAWTGLLWLPKAAAQIVHGPVAAGGYVAATCDTTTDTLLVDYGTDGSSNSTISGNDWRSCQFRTPSGGMYLTEVDVWCYDSGSDAGALQIALRADDGSNRPTGSDITGTVVSVNASSVSNSVHAFVAFVVSPSVTLSGNTLYHIVQRATGGGSFGIQQGGGDSTNDNTWGASSNAGASWTAYTSNKQNIRVYGCSI